MKKLALIGLLVSLAACTPSWQPEGEERLCIEGWIDDGAHPVVIVTTSVPTSTEYQKIDDQGSHLVKMQCKVWVSDGDNTVMLDGVKDDRYYPPFIWTSKTASSMISGVAGKTYSLKVEYDGHTVTGSTTIPAGVPLDSLWCEPYPDDESKYCIKARFTDPEATEDYYGLFVKVAGQDSTFVPAYMGSISDRNLSRPATIDVMKGMSVNNEHSWAFNPAAFEKGDKLSLRFCTMDRGSYDFWYSYFKVVSLSVVPMFPATYNPEYNVSGGIGCWCGYGAKEYSITVK
ncbi:MAG: DUF4249 domain-containing protein [Bacteroidales bacterium]|nr:DUF4249 domain-containing protein [Bacteroidales bacterium]